MTRNHALTDKKVLVLTVGCINYDHDINHFDPIRQLFPNSIRYNYYERFQQIGRRAMNREVLLLADRERPDYVFYITHRDEVRVTTLSRLKNRGIVLIGWFSDDQWRFDSFSKNLVQYLDFPITTSREAYEAYGTLGFRPVLCQWGANPRFYTRLKHTRKRYDVTFVGGGYGERPAFVDSLRKEGIQVRTFGRGWNERISFDDMIRIFCESKINLNFSSSGMDPNVKQIKGRVFEIPMCGGFLLTEYVEGMEEVFEIGGEITCFADSREAARKIQHFLSHDKERERIAEAGRRRAIECHTWDQKLTETFETIQRMEQQDVSSPRVAFLERIANAVFQR